MTLTWILLEILCLLALALSASSGPWPYNQPITSAGPACHKQKRNVRTAEFCTEYTCGPSCAPPWAPLQINTSTPEACCDKCRNYRPLLGQDYGGHFCNVWNWCGGTFP